MLKRKAVTRKEIKSPVRIKSESCISWRPTLANKNTKHIFLQQHKEPVTVDVQRLAKQRNADYCKINVLYLQKRSASLFTSPSAHSFG